MAFDDYSYKIYNDLLLNPKTIKQINEEETRSVAGGPGLDVKSSMGLDD
jgi:hypothetical protein